ncbi:uncharacterized protein [Musca autumnalis]|uniref:uncharacterized protein n=1 Tax=Musca autumnalis TaxID=221902 RepID=UPI003CF30B4F
MKFKVKFIIFTLILGCALVVAAYPDSEDTAGETYEATANAGSSSNEVPEANEEIYEPALMQQQVETEEHQQRLLHDADLEVETETEVSVKTVRNVSDNQLHNTGFGSSEDTPAAQSAEDYVNDSRAAAEDEEEPRQNNSRMGRLLPHSHPVSTAQAPTNIPDYIRQMKTSDDYNNNNNSQEHLNLSQSDYTDDDRDHNEPQHLRSSGVQQQHSIDYDDDEPKSKENEDIVPLAMRYYDDDGGDGDDQQSNDGGVTAAALHDTNNNYNNRGYNNNTNGDDDDDVDDYHESVGETNRLNNEPVPMPQQHQWPVAAGTPQQRSFANNEAPSAQNSSEEYYDEEMSSKEDELMPTTTATPTHSGNSDTHPTMVILAAGFPLPFQPTTSAPAQALPAAANGPSSPPTISQPPLMMTPASPTLGPTTPPYPIIASAAAAAAALPASSGDKKGKQIPIAATTTSSTTTTSTTTSKTLPPVAVNTPPTTIKTINAVTGTSRRHLLPHEQLRNYIEDAYIRMPLAVIVDPSAESLEKTKALWNEALRANLNIKIILVTLNESDIPAAFNFNNSRQFLTGLNSIKEHEGGDAFRGISHAAELVPYDSAVFISTATLANHTDQVHDAAITLLKKRIRLYLIWFGERALSENETQETVGGILGEVAIRSGGEVLHIVGNENSMELEGSTLTIVADALRGSQELDVPVDTTLSSLHVKIDKLMRRAVLETPNGDINLKKLVKFKIPFMTTPEDDNRLDAFVPLTKLRKATVYKLKIIPEDLNAEYTVFIRGERKADTFLDDVIKHFESYFYEGHTLYPARLRNSKIQSISSGLTITKVSTHGDLRFPDDKRIENEPKSEVETFSVTEIHRKPEHVLPVNDTVSNPAQNTMLNPRSTNVLQRTNTKIEMGIHSQVLISAGMMGQLYFEVTNTGCDSILYNIQVVDEKRYLMRLAPQSIFLRAGQMATVTVTVLVPQGTEAGTVDHITFSTTGVGTTTSLSMNLKVVSAMDIQDNSPPTVSWSFGSRCEGVETSDATVCAERFWSLYVIAQDLQTGIMRLQSNPTGGLMYTKSYTIGSNEPLKATYIANCCEPKVSLVVYDVLGNQKSYSIDVRDLVLNEASIAAIALGVILLVILFILIIWGIVWCCRRRQVVLDMPTYRSHSTRSME